MSGMFILGSAVIVHRKWRQSICVGRACGRTAAGCAGSPSVRFETPLVMSAPELVDVIDFTIPMLGPELSVLARRLCRTCVDVCGQSNLTDVARSGVWHCFLASAAPALTSLIDANASDSEIHRAVMLASFLQRGDTTVWAPNAQGRTPLVAAIAQRRGRLRLVRTLLAARAAPDGVGADGWTPMMWAALRGDTAVCAELLRCGATVNKISRDGTSALLCATRADDEPLGVVELLLSTGADPTLVPMNSPFDEHIDMDVRRALARRLPRRRLVAPTHT
eukprot:TRINITY_DN61409_c0_g1_i1.p1 TRINITY_DN61409_c0_g1~~TRINITY_DN61409_c0_g1_i1.p1  ORF type:complete len:299 (+),score=16.00 TRINITY_DN61409_c0_g1_i1:65-898(+)